MARKTKQQIQKPAPDKKTPWHCVFLIVLLGIGAYANTLHSPFLWDDNFLITDNASIKKTSGITQIFTQRVRAGGRDYNFYRPVQMATYLLDYAIGKLRVEGYHITNIALHILATLCLFWLLSVLFQDHLLACLTSLLFITHPVHTEAIAYISGRSDPLALIFILLTFIFYIKQTRHNNFIFIVAMCSSYILGLLSRELSLIFLLFLFFYHGIFNEKIKAKNIAPLVILTLLYIFLRTTFFKTIPSSSDATLGERLPGFLAALPTYLRLLVVPVRLHMEYGKPLFSWAHPQVFLGIAILIGGGFAIARFRKSKNTIALFSISWFIITLLPVSNLFPINAFMAEHWLYMPSIGYFLLISYGLKKIAEKNHQKITLLLAACLILFYAFLTVRQNLIWSNPKILYETTLRYGSSRNSKIYSNLGNIYRDESRYEEAIQLYKKAIQYDPAYAIAYSNLGRTYRIMNKNDEAIRTYLRAIEISPMEEAYNGLGNVYRNIGKYVEAIASYEKAAELCPGCAAIYFNLGNIFAETDRTEKAKESFLKALELNPDYVEVLINLGFLYSRRGETQKARECFQKAKKINPRLRIEPAQVSAKDGSASGGKAKTQGSLPAA
jgi:tetratricopeptide (TPR) repeat protein